MRGRSGSWRGRGREGGREGERERNKVEMARIYARTAECLERHHARCMAGLIRELGRTRCRREHERQFGQPVPAGHHALDGRGL